ncbi:MAG: hypothetical protein KatS3mg051_0340 [Anaerolineae bacterium]|nr:MAG: hypothetical protein KatS3mg051_0340 [Anaerolineae bacterium]
MKIKTYSPKKDDIRREWFVIDAKDQTLGRLASQVAALLRGKHKPIFTPHMDTGDFVIIVNADKIRVTGKKLDQKGVLPLFRLSGRSTRPYPARATGP